MALKLHPFSGGSLKTLVGKISDYGVDLRYSPRILSSLAVSLLGTAGRSRTRRRFREQIESYQFQAAPIFILGHWRSGTTYLHHLMSQDPRFGYVTSYQTYVPEQFLGESAITRFVVEKSLPKKRPMDNVQLSLRQAEEEEMAMANISRLSYIDTFAFPKFAREIFHRAVLFDGITTEEHQSWCEDYRRLLKMACIGLSQQAGDPNLHHRPLLKSPGNTARISTLLKLFPNAKFIHIYRNPYTIFPSKLLTSFKMMEVWQFQDIDPAEVEENVIYIYEQTMKRYLRDRSLIPSDNLIEIRYESFENNQLDTLKTIYEQFGISDFERWEPAFDAYISSRSGYKKNKHQMDAETIQKISERWEFAIQEWGYSPPHLTPALR